MKLPKIFNDCKIDGCGGYKYPKECPHNPPIFKDNDKDCEECKEDALKAIEESMRSNYE